MVRLLTCCLFFSLVLTGSAYCQNAEGYYYHYSYEDFLATHTAGLKPFKKAVYEQMKYPPICRENKIEGRFKVLLFHHGTGQIELVVEAPVDTFLLAEIKRAFKIVHEKQLHPSGEKYATAFYIVFDLEPFDEIEGQQPDTYFIQGKQVQYKHILSHLQSN